MLSVITKDVVTTVCVSLLRKLLKKIWSLISPIFYSVGPQRRFTADFMLVQQLTWAHLDITAVLLLQDKRWLKVLQGAGTSEH